MSEIVIGCGPRDLSHRHYPRLVGELRKLHESVGVSLLIEGGAQGADSMWRVAAKSLGIPYRTVCADWTKYGTAAGPKRNARMLTLGATLVLAVVDRDPAELKGTPNMAGLAVLSDLPVRPIYVGEWRPKGWRE